MLVTVLLFMSVIAGSKLSCPKRVCFGLDFRRLGFTGLGLRLCQGAPEFTFELVAGAQAHKTDVIELAYFHF